MSCRPLSAFITISFTCLTSLPYATRIGIFNRKVGVGSAKLKNLVFARTPFGMIRKSLSNVLFLLPVEKKQKR